MFTGIKPSELDDPHRPPREAHGPYTISGNNRSSCSWLFTSFLFRLTICREIIQENSHPLPALFRGFDMEVYCFPDPADAKQVMFALPLNFFLGCSDHLLWCDRE